MTIHPSDEMITAKTYRDWERASEPMKDTSTNRWYVEVINPKNGNVRRVRLYKPTDAAVKEKNTKSSSSAAEPTQQREVLGFGEKGYITIFKGINDHNEDWFRKSEARNCRLWGWYFPSNIEVPADLPRTVIPVELGWAAVGKSNGALYPEEEIIRDIKKILGD